MILLKPCSLLTLLWLITYTANSQSFYPGGVRTPFQWYRTDADSASAGSGRRGQLNFHPSLIIDGNDPFRIDLGTRDLHSASYFTVYQSLDTSKENAIWHITNDQFTTLVLTTDRMADLSKYQYMNYRDLVRSQPKVNIYAQHKEKDSIPVKRQWWNIGAKPVTPQLPVISFKGLMPEMIAYDRVLNAQERLQVASYLALKYGITLTEPGATYLNSAGEKIWDGYDYSAWHHNIAGICRDDSAGLGQTMASSSNMPGLLTISTKEQLKNNTFLLWGDNGKPLTPAPKTPGLPLLLQKTWLVKPTGNKPSSTDLTINTKAVDAPLPADPVYWLIKDPAGEGKFTSAGVEFIRMDRLDQDGRAYFDKIPWDKDGSGKDVWGIMIAKDLLLVSAIHQPACSSPRTGGLQTKILGGQSPYQLIVHANNGLSITRRIDDGNAPVDINGLSAGKYFLQVTDARGRIYADSFYINNIDGPEPPAIAASYTLPATGSLRLNTAEAESMPDGLTWQWTGPQGFQSFSPQVTITTPGVYTLQCSRNGCSSTQDLTVSAHHDNILYDVTVYPNPSPAAYNARITLDNPAPVTLLVFDQTGRLLTSQKGDGRSNYQFTGRITTGGVYQLQFVSGLSTTTKKLVITK